MRFARRPKASISSGEMRARLFETRELSLKLAEELSAEDMTAQGIDDASPTKWHLAHTTWFFETFILNCHLEGYRLFDDAFNYCFNSYYEHLGARQPRPKRGLLTRPSVERIMDYRRYVDRALELRRSAEPLDAKNCGFLSKSASITSSNTKN